MIFTHTEGEILVVSDYMTILKCATFSEDKLRNLPGLNFALACHFNQFETLVDIGNSA